jgi:galactokinase
MGLDALKETASEDCQFVVCSSVEQMSVAPGRVEVLGNHTDYNDGFILAAAVDRYVTVAGRRTDGQIASVYSDAYERLHQFNVETLKKDGTAPWADYVMGVVSELRQAGHEVGGFEAAVASDIPLGAGLSSSAALEVGVCMFLCEAHGIQMDSAEMAALCQRAENNFVGMNCGILDQWSSLHGKADALVFLDCREKSGKTPPLGPDLELVVADTRAKHELVDGVYNQLREECFIAAEALAGMKHGATHLRDFTPDELNQWEDVIPAGARVRARHVIEENARVLAGLDALENGNPEALGALMSASHASSRDLFGNSCEELDTMVEIAMGLEGCYGARLSGGGFGGCTVNLVRKNRAAAFAEELGAAYEAKTGITPQMHICRPVDGARAWTASA